MKRLLLISADCHAGLPPERYRDYVDPSYREVFDMALPIQKEAVEEADRKFLKAEFLETWRTEEVARGITGAWDSEERNRQLDADGVAGEIIFPDGVSGGNLPPFGASLSMYTDKIRPEIVPDLQWAGARAHNRWLAEFCQEAPERRAGLALIPLLYDVDAAVAEVKRAKEEGLRGVIIPALFEGYAPYHDPIYDPFWAVCEELEMPMHVHGAAVPDYGESVGTMGIYITEVHWWSARASWFLIWGGVFERFPKLRFVVTELGASWVPELKALMDQRFSDTHFAKKLGDYRSHMSMKPSEYFDRNCWVGASVTARCDIDKRDEIGLGNIMWGSDYPHPEGTWPTTEHFLKESFHGIPEDDVRTILGGNAVEVYGFDPKALEPLVERIGPAYEDL